MAGPEPDGGRIMNRAEFLDAYITCAFWASTDWDDVRPLDETHGPDDLTEEARAKMAQDCARFMDENAGLLERSGMDAGQAGHDFWLTRNHHGAGFWDRDLGVVGAELTRAAHGFGECDLHIGDDGLVYCYP